ncbi:YqgQ family protein [Pueribacillus sp. YX66]|uniref:YqgQ family protein n=1 Tax=Pueribacillus sp. YX66 TaxID=3229242 RepID=UPI00358D0EAA
METIYDIRQLLKRFGIFIYTGNRIADLELLEIEIRELHQLNLIDDQQFTLAILTLRKEIKEETEKLN